MTLLIGSLGDEDMACVLSIITRCSGSQSVHLPDWATSMALLEVILQRRQELGESSSRRRGSSAGCCCPAVVGPLDDLAVTWLKAPRLGAARSRTWSGRVRDAR